MIDPAATLDERLAGAHVGLLCRPAYDPDHLCTPCLARARIAALELENERLRGLEAELLRRRSGLPQ